MSRLFHSRQRVAAPPLMEAADGSGRKRPRSAVEPEEDDGAGVSAGAEALLDAGADAAPAKRQRAEVWRLAAASLACRANAARLLIRPLSHLLEPTPRFVGQRTHCVQLGRLLTWLLRRLPLRLPLALSRRQSRSYCRREQLSRCPTCTTSSCMR